MKAKHIFLSTLALSAAFAACTNEELVENPAIALEGRPTVNLSLDVAYDNAPSTRQGVNENGNFFWTADDALGACLMETIGTVTATNYTNYLFAPKAESYNQTNANFETATPVAIGKYVFYHNYSDAMNKRDGIHYNLPVEQLQNNAAGHEMDHLMANNFQVSPVIDLKEDGITKEGIADVKLPLRMTSIYTYLKIELKGAEGTQDMSIKKIVLTNSSAFENVGTIDATKLGDPVAFNADEATFVAAYESIKNLDKAILKPTGASGSAYLNLKFADNVVLKAGETITAYMLVPSKDYAANLKMEVYTEKGVYDTSEDHASLGLNANDAITKAKFERNQMPKITRTLSYQLDKQNVTPRENVAVNSDQDFADAVEYFNTSWETLGGKTPTITLNKDVTISALPIINVNIKGAQSLIFKNETPIDINKKVILDATAVPTIEIAEGTTVNANYNNSFGSIVNKGTLVVKDKVILAGAITNKAGATITNNGTLVVNGASENEAATTVAPVKAAALITNNSIIKTGAKVTFKADGSLDKYEAEATGILTNVGEIAIAGAKSIDLCAAASLVNEGLITMDAAAKIATNATLQGTYNNAIGRISIVDVNKFTLVNVISNKEGTVTTTVATVADYKTALTKSILSDVTLKENTTWAFAAASTDTEIAYPVTKTLSVLGGVTLKIKETNNTAISKLFVLGTSVAIQNSTIGAAKVALKVTELEFAEGASLKLSQDMTMSEMAKLSLEENSTFDIAGYITNANGAQIVGKVAEGASLKLLQAAAVAPADPAWVGKIGYITISENEGLILVPSKAVITGADISNKAGSAGKIQGKPSIVPATTVYDPTV